MTLVEINNLTKEKIDLPYFKNIAQNVLKKEGFEKKISIVFIKESEIKKINKQYRNKDNPTDVLSFDYGEVIVCPEFVKKNSSDYNKELVRVFLHGILHLIGYDHEKSQKEAKIMFEKEEQYLDLGAKLKIRK